MNFKFIVPVFIIFLASCKPRQVPESDLNIASQEPVSALDYELVETWCSDGSIRNQSERFDSFIPENFDLEFKTCQVTAADLEGNSADPSFALGGVSIQRIELAWNWIVRIFKNPGTGKARWRAVLNWFQNGKKLTPIPAGTAKTSVEQGGRIATSIVIVQDTPITPKVIKSFSERYEAFKALRTASRATSFDAIGELKKLLPGNALYSATFGEVGYSRIKIAVEQIPGSKERGFVRVLIPCQNADCSKAVQDIARQFKQAVPIDYKLSTYNPIDFGSWKVFGTDSKSHIAIINKDEHSIMTFVEHFMNAGLTRS